MARLLANENMPGPLINALRNVGHDVAWIVEDAPGAADAGVLDLRVASPHHLRR